MTHDYKINNSSPWYASRNAWHLHRSFTYELQLLEGKTKSHFSIKHDLQITTKGRVCSGDGVLFFLPGPAQTSLKPQWEGGSWAPKHVQPTDQRFDSMTTNSLSVWPSSQAAKYHGRLPTEPGCRNGLADRHADGKAKFSLVVR